MLGTVPLVAIGLRERKKSATRQALHEAALRPAADAGPDGVTVEAIADVATLSRRAFSNYFASREQALLHCDHVRMRAFPTLVHDALAETGRRLD